MFYVNYLNAPPGYGMLELMDRRPQQLRMLFQLDHERQALFLARREVEHQLGEKVAVRMLAERRHAIATRLKDERARASDLEWEFEEIEVRLRIFKPVRADGEDKPASLELATLQRRWEELEDQILHQLEQIDTLERDNLAIEAEWLRRSGSWAEQEQSVQLEAERIARRLGEVEAGHAEILALLDESDRAAYLAGEARAPGAAPDLVEHDVTNTSPLE